MRYRLSQLKRALAIAEALHQEELNKNPGYATPLLSKLSLLIVDLRPSNYGDAQPTLVDDTK